MQWSKRLFKMKIVKMYKMIIMIKIFDFYVIKLNLN